MKESKARQEGDVEDPNAEEENMSCTLNPNPVSPTGMHCNGKAAPKVTVVQLKPHEIGSEVPRPPPGQYEPIGQGKHCMRESNLWEMETFPDALAHHPGRQEV